MKQIPSAVLFTILRHSCQKHRIVIGFLCLLFTAINLSGQALPIQWQKCLGGSSGDGAASIKMTADGGYILVAGTDSNDGDVTGHHGYGDIWIVKLSQTGVIQWQKCLGGSGDDHPVSIQQTTDGGYIVLGTTTSNDGDVSGWHAAYDFSGWPLGDYWVVKLNNAGAIQWQKCLGGSQEETFVTPTIQQTTDGGYILIGATRSNDGDVSGWHPGFDLNGPVTDVWVVKLNSAGAIEWQKCLGGSGMDVGNSIYQTPDGGYILTASTGSNNGDVSGWHPGFHPWAPWPDGWVVKLDNVGAILWQKCLGGSGADDVYSIQSTIDGGYIIVGYTGSNDGDVTSYHGSNDIWVVKLSQTGVIQWQKCLGGSSYEWGAFIQQTTDGGYIVLGTTTSNDGDVSGNHGGYDIWLVKMSQTGVIQWQKCLGGTALEGVGSIHLTTDGGYILAGSTASNNGDVSGWHAGYDIDDNGNTYPLPDCWLVKLDNAGTIQWQKCLGGSGEDYLYSIQQTPDGGYILGGDTGSNDGDVSGNNGYYDAWIVKLGFDPLPIKLSSITARNRENVNIINWSSASEDPGESYELQRSADGVRFFAIASLPGNGRAADYEYTDTDPIAGFNYYRLLLINNNGNNTFSKIVRAFVKTGIELRLSPNPANEILNIQLSGSVVSKASVQITDVTGKTVLLSNLINNEPKKINISMLAPGVYFLRYRDDQHEIVKKFVVN
jgi:hypothetical protein